MSINWNMTPHPVTEGLTDQSCMREIFFLPILYYTVCMCLSSKVSWSCWQLR